MNRILLLGLNSQYNVLGMFEEQLKTEWGGENIEVDHVVKYSQDELNAVFTRKYDVGFMINGTAFVNFETAEYLAHTLHIPLYSWYVDHPCYHVRRLLCYHNQRSLFANSEWRDYARRHHAVHADYDVVMHAGVQGKQYATPFTERSHKVVFFGSYTNPDDIYDKIQGDSFSPFQSYMIQEGISNTSWTLEKIYDEAIGHFQLELQDEEYVALLNQCKNADYFLRMYYRYRVIQELLNAGIAVEVYGSGWDKAAFDCAELLQYHPAVAFGEVIELCGQTQIVLNIMPWVKTGFHERVATTMLNGALSVSDATSCMEEENLKEEKMVLYSLDRIAELPEKVQYYLDHPDEAERLARNGQSWAEANCTWKNRAEQLLQIFQRDGYLELHAKE